MSLSFNKATINKNKGWHIPYRYYGMYSSPESDGDRLFSAALISTAIITNMQIIIICNKTMRYVTFYPVNLFLVLYNITITHISQLVNIGC